MLFFIVSAISSQNVLASVQSTGEVRSTYDYYPMFPLDELGNVSESSHVFRSRIRSHLTYQIHPALAFHAGVEVLNGQFAGTFSSMGTTIDEIPFRPLRSDKSDLLKIWPTEFYLQKKGETWGYALGIQSFQWGLGILSNDGNQQPTWGDAQQGNHYIRGSIDFAVGTIGRGFVALDSIVRDDNVSIYTDDRAQQVIAGLMGKKSNSSFGILVGHRWQKDRPEIYHPLSPTFVRAIPIDFYGKTQISEKLKSEVELTHIRGTTNRIYSEQTRGEDSLIRSWGGLLRIEVKEKKKNGAYFNTNLFEIGFASGDANPTDNVSTTFYLHSNYNPGLLLFEQVLPMMSVNSLNRLTDKDLIGQQSPGLRYGIQQGNVSNAFFVHYQDDYKIISDLYLRTGFVWVRSMTPITDPFVTAMNGGYPVGYGNIKNPKNDMGTEWLLGFDYKPKTERIQPLIRIDMAWLDTKDNFSSLGIDSLWTIHSKMQISWGGE